MTVNQKGTQKNQSNPCAAIGKIVAFMTVAFAVCALVKTFACGRVCEGCPCHSDSESNICARQEKSSALD
jgi:hypothetical protein